VKNLEFPLKMMMAQPQRLRHFRKVSRTAGMRLSQVADLPYAVNESVFQILIAKPLAAKAHSVSIAG